MKAIVIGSGIGGLSAAIGLRATGWDVEVYERAHGLNEVGAGISLWSNAMHALDRLGVGDTVRAIGLRSTRATFGVEGGRKEVMRYDLATLEERFTCSPLATMVHRVELVRVLEATLPSGTVRFGKELRAIEQDAQSVVATFADGTAAVGDILVGADGVRSIARRCVHPDQPVRYSGYTCWRGVCAVPNSLLEPGHIAEVWGPGGRFGITTMSRGRCYWWATHTCDAEGRSNDEHAEVARIFGTWSQPVPSIIALTPHGEVIRHDIVDRPPRKPWHHNRVVLVGDAAHATTPNLGQGACMAIEDAVVLSRHLSGVRLGATKGADIEHAFEAFTRERFPRTSAITKESRHMGALGQIQHPLLSRIRDAASVLSPRRVAEHVMVKWARHDVGELTPPRSATPGRDAGGAPLERRESDAPNRAWA